MSKLFSEPECGNTMKSYTDGAREINCDQVYWILAAIDRYLPQSSHPSISRAREMQKYGLLYEIMESANLCFEDDKARDNGTPHDASRFTPIKD